MTTPAQLDAASKCYCFNDDQFRRVVAYLLDQISAGGGGGSVQDMQVAWTPTNVKLGQEIGFVTFGDLPGITSITFNQSTSLAGFAIELTSTLTTLSFPNLVSIDPTAAQSETLAILQNTGLTSVSAPLLQTWGGDPGTAIQVIDNTSLVSVDCSSLLPKNGQALVLTGNAFNAATVNLFLARCKANPTWGNAAEAFDSRGGTNAAPSGQGIADKATLIGRGATVNTN